MKLIISLSLLAAHALAAVSMTNEFVQGFESGIFLRGSGTEELAEYGCPEAKLEGPIGNLKDMLTPLKVMGAMYL